MAVIQLLNSIAPRPRYQKIIRAFKEQLDEFDELRDTQVILAEISETVNELPDLASFQKRQRVFEERTLRTLRKRIRKFSITELSRRIRRTHGSIETALDHDPQAQILQAVDDAFMLTKQRLAWVDLTRPATIHKVRIAFKSFRYMVEIVHPLLHEFPDVNLEWMSRYQSLMGEVQDAEVFMQTLDEFSGSASFADLDSIRRYYERRHADAVKAYAEQMNQLNIFWRPAPDQTFPWEKTV
jgi:CHAD domain-containing protein